MKTRTKAFTLVELLTVIGIISLLLALALPALNEARARAREVADRASLHSISVAIESFANDLGYYPPSNIRNEVISGFALPTTLKMQWREDGDDPPDQGAHRLVESLLGLDYLGFQESYYYDTDAGVPVEINQSGYKVETKRWGPYLMLENVNLGIMQEAHRNSTTFTQGNTNDNKVFVDSLDKKAPKAVLYYRARPSKKMHWHSVYDLYSIYNYNDNAYITEDENLSTNEPFHPRFYDPEDEEGFYKFIWDSRTGLDPDDNQTYPDFDSARPFNKDSFILINAGRDHEYGTADDICNFQKR